MNPERLVRLPVDWSRKRKAAVVVLALVMTYLYSLNILSLYVTEEEYWWPFLDRDDRR